MTNIPYWVYILSSLIGALIITFIAWLMSINNMGNKK